MRTLSVNLGNRSYLVLVGRGLIDGIGEAIGQVLGRGKAVVITVPPVERLYLERVRHSLVDRGVDPIIAVVPDGEEAKTVAAYTDVVGRMLEGGAGRDALVVSLGGGCVGDLSGFVASTYMRGVGLVHVPTTLLAQVDSSIGGKTALNHPNAKNLIGTFYQPKLVVSDTSVLRTLPPKEVKCGLSEVVKYGTILDRGLFEFLESSAAGILDLQDGEVETVVCRSVEIKSKVVAEDEGDHGTRMLLNFGHTVGHAIEAASGYRGYSHGEAVAIGMVAEGLIAMEVGIFSEGWFERLRGLLLRFGLPTKAEGLSVRDVIGIMRADKKVEGGEMRFALPGPIGSGEVIKVNDRRLVERALRGVLEDQQ